MIAAILAVLAIAQTSSEPRAIDIAQAIAANRLEQARQMLADATSSGYSGTELDKVRADLAFARGNWVDARARYIALAEANPKDGRSAERAAIASMLVGDANGATRLAETAIRSGAASWRAWNAQGVLCIERGDWDCADKAFEFAASMAPNEPKILNNTGWSLFLRGEWGRAAELLGRAAQLDPQSQRIKNNLELARAALADDLPQRQPDETASAFAARLNDAGVVASMRGDRSRAIAAFSRALEVSERWYARAAANLERIGTK